MTEIKAIIKAAAFGFTIVLFLNSCNESTTVGAGIVDTDVIPIETIDLDIRLEQREDRPFTSYAAGGVLQSNEVQCGKIEDAVFGSTESTFYMQFYPVGGFLNNNSERVVDSVIFVLYLDSLGTYGEHGTLQLSIDRMTEMIDGARSHLSNSSFPTGETIVEDFSFEPDYGALDEDDEELGPYVNISFPKAFGEEVLALDSSILNDATAFVNNFNGIHVRPTGGANQLVGFKPYLSNEQSVASSIRIMYRDSPSDTTDRILSLAAVLGSSVSPVVPTYKHDYTGSMVEQALANPEQDSNLYIQGHGGVMVDIYIDAIHEIGPIGVNKAELFIPLSTTVQPDDNEPPMRTLFMTRENLSGTREFIPEFTEANVFQFRPMGRVDTLNGRAGYYYNIPTQLGDMIDGTIISDEIRLQNVVPSSQTSGRDVFGPRNLAEATARSVIFGQNSLSQPLQIKITYTDE